MATVNNRLKKIFIDRDESAPAQRAFSFDEATLVAVYVEGLAQRNMASQRPFSVGDALRTLSLGFPHLEEPTRYVRPMVEFLQSQVNVGLLREATPPTGGPVNHLRRRFAAGSTLTMNEWARGSAVLSLGLPYVAHVFGDIAVRVHHGVVDEAPIASGVVVQKDWVITNRHVVEGSEEIHISWGQPSLVKAKEVLFSSRFDLAAVHVPGFEPYPIAWLRRPRLAEPVIVLAYPEIPQVDSRPLLSFNGWIATAERLKTYFGDEQIVVSAVMGPGASGGPIFGADGCLVAIVVQTLEGKRLAEDGHTMQSTFHAALPADLVLEELRCMDPRLKAISHWG